MQKLSPKGTQEYDMKNNIDYYQHYATSDQHPKFKMLRVKFGWSGEGKFWALNNRIALSENCCLNISKKYNKASIANDLNFTIQELDDFILYLKDDCELIYECEPGIITTDIIQENFGKVSEKRIKNQKIYRNKIQTSETKIQTAENGIQPSENIQSKVKESKEKKSKVKKKKEKNLKIYLRQLINKHDMEDVSNKIMEFFEYRMSMPKKKQYNSELGLNGLFRNLLECRNEEYDLTECIDIAMENNWLTPNQSYYNFPKKEGKWKI